MCSLRLTPSYDSRSSLSDDQVWSGQVRPGPVRLCECGGYQQSHFHTASNISLPTSPSLRSTSQNTDGACGGGKCALSECRARPVPTTRPRHKRHDNSHAAKKHASSATTSKARHTETEQPTSKNECPLLLRRGCCIHTYARTPTASRGEDNRLTSLRTQTKSYTRPVGLPMSPSPYLCRHAINPKAGRKMTPRHACTCTHCCRRHTW